MPGAAATIRQALIDLAARGAAVLVISQDLDELAEIADRIAVMFHGRLSAPLDAAEASREKLGLLMGGSTRDAGGGGSCGWCLSGAPSARPLIAIVSPLIAIALTLVTMTVLFALLGKNPFAALYVYFIEPLTDAYSLQEIAVKAAPLVMIARRPVALLPRQCLEHRRRGPVPDRRRAPAAGSRS